MGSNLFSFFCFGIARKDRAGNIELDRDRKILEIFTDSADNK